MIKSLAIIAGWGAVVATALTLRFEDLAERPMHADEATGARLLADRLEAGRYVFDPSHYHGPTQSRFAIPLARLRGENCWGDLSKLTLRLLPALAGTLLVLAPLFGRRRWGDGPMLVAAALLATSPLLVYYSRMFIHESLMVLFGMVVVFTLPARPRHMGSGILPGLAFGLMAATKESVAISILAWAAAGLVVAAGSRAVLTRERLRAGWIEWRAPLGVALATAAFTSLLLYTNGFQRLEGAWDAIRTYFVYHTVEGHDKGAGYYLELLAVPKRAAGRWWFETPVLLLALWACATTFRPRFEPAAARPVVRFLALSAVAHFLIYSLIAYKTPWLMCLPWAHVCVLAGFSVCRLSDGRLRWQLAAAPVIALALASQVVQSRRATGQLASDARNPYAYVPTSHDVEALETWLLRLRADLPPGSLDPLTVVGSNYWPLPWYLRRFDRVGYWPDPPEHLESLPLILVPASSIDGVAARLGETHIALPRGLRADDPLYLFLRLDLWDRWMKPDTP